MINSYFIYFANILNSELIFSNSEYNKSSNYRSEDDNIDTNT